MKVYKFDSSVNGEGSFAILRPSNEQDVRTSAVLDVWWDDWGSGVEERLVDDMVRHRAKRGA